MLKSYINALKNEEDFMLSRLYKYASEADYTKYTSTKEDDWRMTLKEPSKSLISFLENNDNPDKLHVDEEFDKNPAASFGILEARRHRQRGVSHNMFLGLTKLVKQSFIDLVYETSMPPKESRLALDVTHRFFDKFELGFTSEWMKQ